MLSMPDGLSLVISCHSFVLSGRPVARADDLRQARELAMLICTSEEAIETFIAHYDLAAMS